MIKWFFLAFAALIFVISNFVVFDAQRSMEVYFFGAVSVNLFGVSLFAIWLGAYHRKFKDAGYLVYGHAIFMLSAAVGFIGFGVYALSSDGCAFLISDQRRPTGISKLALWAIENNACSTLAVSFIIFGLFFGWPSVKLFVHARIGK